MSKFSSTMITEAPVSRAAQAQASPETPAPTTTTSADRCHLMSAASASFVCSPTAAAATPAAPCATLVLRKRRRLTGFDFSLMPPSLPWREHDSLRGLGHQFLVSRRDIVGPKNEGQNVQIRLVAQAVRRLQGHTVPYPLETFAQSLSVPLGSKRGTREVDGLGVRGVKVAPVATRAAGLIRLVPSLGLCLGEHTTPERRTRGLLGAHDQRPEHHQHRERGPDLFHCGEA